MNEIDDLATLNLSELHRLWMELWAKKQNNSIPRNLLEKSIRFKILQLNGKGFIAEEEAYVTKFIQEYENDPSILSEKKILGIGSRIIRTWRGKKYVITVKRNGFEYNKELYSSLSKVTFVITGTKWNGWTFFKLKHKGKFMYEISN